MANEVAADEVINELLSVIANLHRQLAIANVHIRSLTTKEPPKIAEP